MNFKKHLKTIVKKGILQFQGKRSGIHILTYHGLIENRTFPRLQRNFHTVHEFQEQIEYLKKTNTLVLKPTEFEEIALSGDLKKIKKAALITFDDGYENNKIAMSILDENRMKAAYFISTGCIDTQQSVWTVNISLLILCGNLKQIEFGGMMLALDTLRNRKDSFNKIREVLKSVSAINRKEMYFKILSQFPEGELNVLIERNPEFKMFSWREIKELSESGEFFQSHGVYHELFRQNQDEITLRNELKDSKLKLELVLNKKINWYAYPNGNVEQSQLGKLMKEYKYDLGFGLTNRAYGNSDLNYFIPRYEKPRKRMLEFIF